MKFKRNNAASFPENVPPFRKPPEILDTKKPWKHLFLPSIENLGSMTFIGLSYYQLFMIAIFDYFFSV